MGRTMRKWWMAVLLLLAAAPALGLTPAESAQKTVMDTTESMFTVLDREREALRKHPEHIYGIVKTIILPHFDFDRISQWVLGRYWRQADETQRRRFTEEFRTLLVRTYATALLEFTDQTVEYLPPRVRSERDEVLVRTQVTQKGGASIPINYRMYVKEGEWRVYDVTIDGISLVSNYRTAFSSEIQRRGLDQLIALLARKNGTDSP